MPNMTATKVNASLDAYYGKDEPSASFKWGVIVPITTGATAKPHTTWTAVAWFKTAKRAKEYAESGWSVYAIARLKDYCL